MKILIAYNFDFEEADIIPPNFYRSMASKWIELGHQVDFFPNLKLSFSYKLLCKIFKRPDISRYIIYTFFLIFNLKKYDIAFGWLSYGSLISACKILIKSKTKSCFIVYNLRKFPRKNLMQFLYVSFYFYAAKRADILLTLDSAQSEYYAKLLRRPPNATINILYGVDSNWYKSYLLKNTQDNLIFIPGSAYRDDISVIGELGGMDCKIERFQLSKNVNEFSTKFYGTLQVDYFYNQPYEVYIAHLVSASIVVIPVDSKHKPVGLTSLMECMALGKPIIISKGCSSRDYVKNGYDAVVYDQNIPGDLRNKVMDLISNKSKREYLSTNALNTAKDEFNVNKCAKEILRKINQPCT